MTFQLQAFKAYPIRVDGAVRQHARQVAQLQIAATAADLALDISNAAGTFWTAAEADATYGELATLAQAVLAAIAGNAKQLLSVKLPTDYVQVTGGAAGKEYTVAVTGNLPDVELVNGSAPTAYVVTLEWILQDGLNAITADYGAPF